MRMKEWRRLVVLGAAWGLGLAGCAGGPIVKTESTMRDWGEALKLFFTSGYGSGPEFPHKLDDVKSFPGGRPSGQDGWGHDLVYQWVSMDKYRLISKGPDGQLGNDDDIVYSNGMLEEAKKSYAAVPAPAGG